MKNKCDYQIFVGLGNSPIKVFFKRRKIRATIIEICSKHNAGFTLFKSYGGYAGKTAYVTEQGFVLFITDAPEEGVRLLAEDLRKALKQESVVFRKVNAQSELL